MSEPRDTTDLCRSIRALSTLAEAYPVAFALRDLLYALARHASDGHIRHGLDVAEEAERLKEHIYQAGQFQGQWDLLQEVSQ